MMNNPSHLPWLVVHVEPEAKEYCLFVKFIDGLSGFVEMSSLIHSDKAGIFRALKDPDLFTKAYIKHGAVTWPGDIDLAPDAMYAQIQKNAVWILTSC